MMLMVVVLVKTMMWRPSHAWTGIVGDIMCGVRMVHSVVLVVVVC